MAKLLFTQKWLDRIHYIGSPAWLREKFPDKDWHEHPRADGNSDLCDGTPSDCAERVRL